jgi:PhnB protein
MKRYVTQFSRVQSPTKDAPMSQQHVPPIPAERPSMAPYIVVRNAASAIEFYTKAFGAKERFRLSMSGDKVAHAELDVLGSRLLLADEFPDFGAIGPLTLGGSPVSLHVYVEDVDALVKRAVAEGADVLRPLKDEFYGDRVCLLADPFGHRWHLATRKEEVSPEEMQRRMEIYA